MFKRIQQKAKQLITGAGFILFSCIAQADQLAPMKGATDWLYKTLTWVALTVLGLQIMFRLWQVNQGQKEWSEVAKPILVTGGIAAVPMVIGALVSAMGGA